MPGLWIEYHTSLWENWKIRRLATRLSIPYAYALGMVSAIWLWTANNKADGNLSGFSDEEIAAAAKWEGAMSDFKMEYLRECRLIDPDGKLHDWEKHGTRVLTQARIRTQKCRNPNKEPWSDALERIKREQHDAG